MNAGAKPYFHLLSALRGLAAIFVVMLHTGPIFEPISFPMSGMAVDLFFLLSGVVIEARYRQRILAGMSPLHFFGIRIIRLYPLYILGAVITLLTLIAAHDHRLMSGEDVYNIPHKVACWLLGMVFIPAPFAKAKIFPFDGPAWSLFFELFINLIYAFILQYLTRNRLIAITAVFGALLLAALARFHHEAEFAMGWTHQTFVAGFFRTGVSFFLGVLIYRLHCAHPLRLMTRYSTLASAVIILAVLMALLCAPPSKIAVFVYVLSVFLIFPTAIYASLAVEPAKPLRQIWDFLGDISYPIYTLHLPAYYFFCSIIVTSFGISLPRGAPGIGLCFLAVMTLLSAVLYRLYDRPLQTILRSQFEKRYASRAASPYINTIASNR